MQHGPLTAGIALTLIQQGGNVKPFKKKGFPVYNLMTTLMPNRVRGTHASHPSDQTFGAIANQPTSSNSNILPPAPRGNIGKDDVSDKSDDNEQVVPPSSPMHPPVSTSSTSVNSFASRQSKRKHSALGDGDSASIQSSSHVSSQNKHQHNPGASALVALSAKMDRMNDTFWLSLILIPDTDMWPWTLTFSYFATAAGKNLCGSLVLFGPQSHTRHVASSMPPKFLFSACCTLSSSFLCVPPSTSLVMVAFLKFLNHTMPESDKEVQKLVEERIGIWLYLWQIKVVWMILEQWDVIEITATSSGKSLPYWMPLLFIKHGIIVLVTPLKLLREQFVKVLEKNELKAVSMTASNSNNELFEVCVSFIC
jgi:hypothetical protein